MCFSDKGFLEINSVFNKTVEFSSMPIIHKKTITTDIIIIIIIIIKRGWQCKAGRERLTPYQSEDPSPTHRKKEEKEKTVGDKK